MKRPASGSWARSAAQAGGALSRRVGDDGVRAVEVLVDELHQVGGAQLRDHVVARVLVGGAGALGGLEPADDLGRAGGRGRRGVGVPDPAEHHGEGGAVGARSGVTIQ